MMILEFFKKNRECVHSKVRPDADVAYCPDCGELIENRWFLTRCACCGVKLRAIIKNGMVVPEEHFCHNCGSKEFVVEKLEKISFIDINYAVLVKTIVIRQSEDIVQSWVDTKSANYNPELLPQFM